MFPRCASSNCPSVCACGVEEQLLLKGCKSATPSFPIFAPLFHHPGPDRGSKYDKPGDEKKMHKVFVTYSFKVTQMVKDHAIKINY